MDNKNELRRIAKECRKRLDILDISQRIAEHILEQDWYRRATDVMIFYPLDSEISLLSLMNSDKDFYLPRVCGKELEICPYKVGDELVVADYGVKEPKTFKADKDCIDIIFTPALMIDKNFHRLGYGGGYYDRLLSDYSGMKVGVVSEKLFVDNIPSDIYDVKLDFVVTEKGVY